MNIVTTLKNLAKSTNTRLGRNLQNV